MARRPDNTLPPTPLRRWRETHPEVSWEELARRAELGVRTVKRAAAGDPIDAASAEALARVTGIPVAELLTSDSKRARRPPPAAPTPEPVGDRNVKPAKVRQREQRDDDGPSRLKTKDPRTRAVVLVAAELVGDERAAEQFGVGTRSIRRWRADLATDGPLARAYARRLDSGWALKLSALVETVADRGIRLLNDHALSLEHLRDLAALLETAASLLVQREALTRRAARAGDDDDGEGEPSDHRDGAPVRSDRPGAGARTTH